MKISLLLFTSIISSFILLLFHVFRWELLETFTLLLMPIIWLGVYGFFFINYLIAIFHIFRKKDRLAFYLQSLVFLLVLIIPFERILIDFNFTINKSQLSEVVSMVQNQTIKPLTNSSKATVELPKKYAHLSTDDGSIKIEELDGEYSILFYTYKGIQDDFNGYIFSPNEKKPSIYSFGGDLKEIQRIDENWYYVISY